MNRNLGLWQFAGFVLSVLGGTLLHFVYDWSGNSSAALFSGVNESTWEHMKLLYYPMFIFSLVQRYYFREDARFWCIKLRGMLTGLILIPVLFYTYNGVLGTSPDWVNIGIFFVAAAVAFWKEWRLFHHKKLCCYPKIAFAILCTIGLLFVVFTFSPPRFPLFSDPRSGGYGIIK